MAQHETTFAQHSAEMHRTHGEHLTEKQHDAIYGKAYADGHAHGYSDVESHYIDLAELAEKLTGK